MLQVSYRTGFTHGAFRPENDALASLMEQRPGSRVLVLLEKGLEQFYPQLPSDIDRYFEKNAGVLAYAGCCSVPGGEEAKTGFSAWETALRHIVEAGIDRHSYIIAVGGGAFLDVAGFAAATYQRGIPYVQVPTTLLSAVDSSVGGKTAVNLPGGKNQVGAFHQPALVLCDPDLLHSLPPQEYQNGCGELVKYAMLSGDPLYSALLSEPVSRLPEQVISACVEIKRDFVQSDEWDTGCRRLLNFGHTVGHAIESCSHYAVSHGQAVAIGMAVLTRAACHRSLCTPEALSDLERLLASYDLPTHTDFSAQAIARAALSDKKRRGDRLPLILPEAVGRCRVEAIPARDFVSWLRDGGLL